METKKVGKKMTIVQFWLLGNEMDRSQEKTKTRNKSSNSSRIGSNRYLYKWQWLTEKALGYRVR